MKKAVLILIVLLSTKVYSQKISLNTPFYKAVDQWVVMGSEKDDGSYACGFIYFDMHDGFTYNYETNFVIKNGKFKRKKRTTKHQISFRLDRNSPSVYVLNQKERKQLKLPQSPKWLKEYKKSENEIQYLVNFGYYYNHVGGSEYAIKPLLEAYEKDPKTPGLLFELTYAHNAVQKYEKAIEYAHEAINLLGENVYFYKELGFAYRNLGELEKAEKTYDKLISLTDDPTLILEAYLNMVQAYFVEKNLEKFNFYVNKLMNADAYSEEIGQYIELMKTHWDSE